MVCQWSLEVEKILGIDGKPQIEEYGVGPFIENASKVFGNMSRNGEKNE